MYIDIQSLSPVLFFETAACQASLSFTVYQHLLRLMSIELVMPSNHLFLCPSVFPRFRVFPNELGLHIS